MNNMRVKAINVLSDAGLISRWDILRRLETLTDKELLRHKGCGGRTLEACHEVIDELCSTLRIKNKK